MITPPLAAYVHFPWCVKKCPYCDFNSHPVRGNLDEAGYLQALLNDLERYTSLLKTRPLASIFLGGGTPSLFQGRTMATLLSALPEAPEVTMEANPGTTEHARFEDYLNAGINRLSLGAQSFSDHSLMALGRIHKASDTERAFQSARNAGFDNINLDLMYGLPHQTLEEAMADLQQAIALSPEHLSWYQLTLEPKTEFAQRPPPLPDDDALADMEAAGYALLANTGYVRYEVSAYAKPGYQCLHNRNYWEFGDYIGIGAGAHGKLTRGTHLTRTRKASQPRIYLDNPESTEEQPVPADQRPIEFMMNALRLVEGVPFAWFTERTGLPWDTVSDQWSLLQAEGFARQDRIALTATGYMQLNGILSRFAIT